jgi:hypothetical protein
MAGSGRKFQRAHDKRRGETLPERVSSTHRLPKRLPAPQTPGEKGFRPDPEDRDAGWCFAEMQKSRTVLLLKQVPSLVRAGTLPLQSMGQEHTPKPRYSI